MTKITRDRGKGFTKIETKGSRSAVKLGDEFIVVFAIKMLRFSSVIICLSLLPKK